MRCLECAAETGDAQLCVWCGAPAQQSSAVADLPAGATSNAADWAVPAVIAAGTSGWTLPEPYVPGSGDRVPAQIRRVLWGYTGVALGAVAGGFALAVSFLPDNPGWENWFNGGLFFTSLALWGWAVVLFVQRIRFWWLLRRPRRASSATVVAYERDMRTLTLDAPLDGYLSEFKVRLAWLTKAGMLLPGDNVTVYERPTSAGPVLVTSAQRNMAFLGGGRRRASLSSPASVPPQPLKSMPDSEVDGAIVAEWVEPRIFSTTRLRPGYKVEEVDAFLDAIRDSFLGVREPSLTPDEIRDKRFSTTRLRPGYDEEEVDVFLDEAELRLASQVSARCGAPVARQTSAAADVAGGHHTSMWPSDTPDEPVSQRTGYSRFDALVMIAAGLAVLAAVIVHLAVTSQLAGQLTEDQLQPGDCLRGSNLGLGSGGTWPDYVTAVPCTQQHLAEVFFAGNAWPQSLTAYPGDNVISDQGSARCNTAFSAYDRTDNSESAFTIYYVVPYGANDWASGDRRLVCMAYQPGITANYSIKGSNR